MSSIRIKVIAVELASVPTQKGSYQTLDVTYKNQDFGDKTETKKVMSFTFKEVFNVLKDAKSGDTFTINRVKNDKGYWDWVSLGEGGAAPAEAAKSGSTPARSSFESPEERAARQVYIVRQSSISAAIETLKTEKKNPTKEEVIELASYYEDFVFGRNKEAKPAIAKITVPDVSDDDIPY